MKILILFLIFLINFPAFGGQFILYPFAGKETETRNYLSKQYDSVPVRVFTIAEVKSSQLPESIANALKIKIPTQLVEKFLSDSEILNFVSRIETNSKVEFQESEYETLQWGRKNTGKPIELKLTDIDRLTLPAVNGEDIHIGSLAEVEGNKVRVAVIDSGIDLNHPEFRSIIYTNENECKALAQYKACLSQNKDDDAAIKACHEKWAKTDTDNNGYPMDCHGWNVAAPVNPFNGVQGNNDVLDLVGHGTHISGIIGALQDHNGTSGVIKNVEILPVKVSGSTEEVQEDNTTDIFAKGILYALKQNVDVINLSVGWSSKEDSLLVSELIKKAHELGVLVVVAGGNSSHSTETYPCSYNEVICVGSHNPDGTRSHFSNFGSSIDVYAPGHNILSTWPLDLRPKLFTERHGYEYKNGTSFSAPFVVGVLARLLNLGFSPDEARVKMLSGLRKGNVDLVKAVAFDPKSFIYPYKKSAAFINWHEGEKKFVLKLKNFLRDVESVRIKVVPKNKGIIIKDDLKEFSQWAKDEIKDVTFLIEGYDEAPSEMTFDLFISSPDESKSYSVQAIATTVIHDRFSRPDTERVVIQTNKDLEAFDFLPVKNIFQYKGSDFLISQVIDGKLAVALLKGVEGRYKISRLQTTIFDKALIIQAAKVDLDLDNKPEYVLTGMFQNKDKKWTARFYVYDENFNLSALEICPGNEHINLLTSMSTELHWMKRNKRMVPTWIAEGFSPSIDLPPFNPWTTRISNTVKKRIYYLDDKGLRSLTIPSVSWADFQPIEFFNESIDDLKEGNLKFLFTLDQGFIKTYSLSNTSDLAPAGNYVMSRYQNLYPIDGMKFENTQDVVFSETDSITGRGRLSVVNPLETMMDQLEYFYDDPFDPIQLVLNKTERGNYFAHTKYGLLYLEEGAIYKTESRNTSNQIQYKRIKSREALYLSSDYTPGLSSELVQYQDGQIIRPAKYRFLVGNGCQEIGYNYSLWEEQDQIYFYCDKSKSLFKIRL